MDNILHYFGYASCNNMYITCHVHTWYSLWQLILIASKFYAPVPAYVDRLTMPKLLINTGGDEFFLPDDNHYFWNDLPGEKFVRYS